MSGQIRCTSRSPPVPQALGQHCWPALVKRWPAPASTGQQLPLGIAATHPQLAKLPNTVELRALQMPMWYTRSSSTGAARDVSCRAEKHQARACFGHSNVRAGKMKCSELANDGQLQSPQVPGCPHTCTSPHPPHTANTLNTTQPRCRSRTYTQGPYTWEKKTHGNEARLAAHVGLRWLVHRAVVGKHIAARRRHRAAAPRNEEVQKSIAIRKCEVLATVLLICLCAGCHGTHNPVQP